MITPTPSDNRLTTLSNDPTDPTPSDNRLTTLSNEPTDPTPSDNRPSLRKGLPYGWWRSSTFWEPLATALSIAILVALMTILTLAWWF